MSKQRTGLGKGLGALIPTSADTTTNAQSDIENRPNETEPSNTGLRMVEIRTIQPNPHQPRSEFEPEALAELAESIKVHGLIQPLIVTPDPQNANHYILIAGERRWRASQLAGLTVIPVVIKGDTTAQEMLEIALIENIQRADLNALEEGEAYRQLVDEFGLTHADVAQRVGKARTTVTNMIRLLELPDKVREAIIRGQISGGHAKALAALDSPDQQLAVLTQLMRHAWSVRQTEEVVQKLKLAFVPTKKDRPNLPPELADLERQIRNHLGTRVNIEKGKEGGRIVIHYYSEEELDELYGKLTHGDDHEQ